MKQKPDSFGRVFVETQLFMLSLLGWLVFWSLMAVGASGGGDLDQASKLKQTTALVISTVAYSLAILGPSAWPEHVPAGWRLAALVTIALSLLLGVFGSVWVWRGTRSP